MAAESGALAAVNGLLAKLAEDEDLHDDLKQPQVQVAMRHWTGKDRLPPEQATKLMGDYRVMAVLQKVKALQLECRRAGIAVPLDSVLRRDRALSLPGGGLGGAQAPAAEKKGKDKSKSKGKGKEAAHEAPAATPISAAARSEAVPAATAPAAAAAASVASAVTGQQRYGRRPPQTLFEWLHLLSPLLTLIFGILYALARAMGTGAGAAS